MYVQRSTQCAAQAQQRPRIANNKAPVRCVHVSASSQESQPTISGRRELLQNAAMLSATPILMGLFTAPSADAISGNLLGYKKASNLSI